MTAFRQYTSRYQLELLGFNVEASGDGIFELGECVLIRRIGVQNTGECGISS